MLALAVAAFLLSQDPAPAVEPTPAPAPAAAAPAAAAPAADAPALKAENAGRIAVAQFRATGVAQDLADGVADVLAIELEKFQGVDLLTRNDIKSVLSQSAEAQLLGCDDPRCFVDAGKLVPARYLLTGSITKLGNNLVVQAALVDLAQLKVGARASATLAGGTDDIAAALRTIALGLYSGDAGALGDDATLKGEVDAQMLDRVRIAQRARGPAFHLYGGAVYSTTFALGEPSDPEYPGGAGRVTASFPIVPWLSFVGGAGGAYYVGRFVNQATFAFGGGEGLPKDTNGAFVADYSIADGNLSLGAQLEVPTGFVRPFVRVSGVGDVLRLDVSDLVFQPAEGQPDLAPPFGTPIKFDASTAPGGGVELAVGTDFNIGEHFGLSAELSSYGKLHGLEKVFQANNVVKHQPLAPLAGVTLFVGVFYEM